MGTAPRGEGPPRSLWPSRHRSGGFSRSVRFGACVHQIFRRTYAGECRQALFSTLKSAAATLRRWQIALQGAQRGAHSPAVAVGFCGRRDARGAARRWALLPCGAAPALPAPALSSAAHLTRRFGVFPPAVKRPSHKRRLPRVPLHGSVRSFCSKTFLRGLFFFFFF